MTISQAQSMHLSIVDALPKPVTMPRRKTGETNAQLIDRLLAIDVDAIAIHSDPDFPVNPCPPRQ